MNYAKIQYPTTSDGLGFRVSLYTSGCTLHCKGCHNPKLWKFDYGKEFTEETLNKLVESVSIDYIDGLSVLGGEPLDNYEDVLNICKVVKERTGKNIWLYTGYEKDVVWSKFSEILEYVDTIVVGRFIYEQRDTTLAFRGSANQEIINVHEA